MFQSQTGSPSSSDGQKLSPVTTRAAGFNPKREAHPLQTAFRRKDGGKLPRFNPKREAHPLQTYHFVPGSGRELVVSIPNGKPILFRHRTGTHSGRDGRRFNPKREAHPLQTHCMPAFSLLIFNVSIPNGKPILFRRITG